MAPTLPTDNTTIDCTNMAIGEKITINVSSNGSKSQSETDKSSSTSQPIKAASRKRSDGPKVRAIPSLVALPATSEHNHIQRMTCQSLKKNRTDTEQCQSCIERRNDSGGCRFAGFRAFKSQSETGQSNQAPSPTETNPTKSTIAGNKRKATPDSQDGVSKKRKVNLIQALPSDLDYTDYRLVGDRMGHADHKLDSCLYSSENRVSDVPHHLSDDDAYIMSKIAPTFNKVIKRELEHEQQTAHPQLIHPVLRVTEDPSQRSMCDSCATTLFVVSYTCVVCGKEYCPDCYTDWQPDVEEYRFDMCSRTRRHTKAHLLLVVRACEGELARISQEIELYLAHVNETTLAIPPEDFIVKSRVLSNEIFMPVYEVNAEKLDEKLFRNIWGRHGLPIVINGCLPRFDLSWTPEYFIKNHGTENCTLVQCCPPYAHMETKVKEFFLQFGQSHARQSLKLKDWPPSASFSEVFPELFQDFESAIPEALKQHIQRSGLFNLVSRFPKDYNKPDLGPKMYNAFPATIQAGGEVGGTTNLHLDITDAINFMMYAVGEGESPDGMPTPSDSASSAGDGDEDGKDRTPGAIWDIFSLSATEQIRTYLNEKFPDEPNDPIHRQTCYLTEADLENLADLYDIRSFRIYQRPGDAVMIPAGCAHQVRNVKDCIKVAVDFLSPENVRICETLLQENRKVAERSNAPSINKKGKEVKRLSKTKKEDVLQLWKCLMYYYSGVREKLWATA